MVNGTGFTYVVKTDMDPVELGRAGLYVFDKWMEFALGAPLGGKRIVYPTGRYAASLQFRQYGEAAVAVVADESMAPEAAILETGHGPVDMKTKLQAGRGYPMHRFTGGGGALRRTSKGKGPSSRPTVWAEARSGDFSGFASFGPKSDPGSWVIPAMPAYSPAGVLAAMVAAKAKTGTAF